jgi:Cytochrome C oxidase, cbb3-type, subunit III
VRPHLLLLLLIGLLAGCGGGDGGGNGGDGGGGGGGTSEGSQVFAEAGCGTCHTYEPAGSTGSVGPSLDDSNVTFDQAVEQIRNGGGGMPAFEGDLSDQEIDAVARFVTEGGGSASGDGGGGSAVGPFRPDDTRLEGCLDADCRRQAFGNIAYREGPKPALDLFQEKLSDQAVEADCHRIAHTIGAASLVHHDGNVARALADGRATCWSGYYHGVVERSFVGASRGELPARSRQICADPDIRRTSFLAYQCVHGLGHGLMIHTGYDLPGALEVCNKLETAWDHDSCEAGVFMENISSSYGIKSRWLRDDDLIYPCNAIAERYKLYCYLILTSRVLQANGYDWEQTVATCRQSDKGWVATCFQSLGRDASGYTRQNAPKILEICALAGDMNDECVYGAARDVTSNDASPRRSKVLCETAAASLRAYCFEGIGTILGGMHALRAGRRQACLAVTKTYARACFRGAVAL